MQEPTETPDTTSSALVVADRKERINLSGDVVNLATSEYPEPHRALIRWLFGYAKDNNMSWKEAAAFSHRDVSTLYKIWTGRYRYPEFEKVNDVKTPHPKAGQIVPLDSICEDIASAKELAEERAMANRLPFIETSVWRRVDKLCREALIMQAIAHIYGESQIGKTACLKEHANRNNHGQTIYVLCPAAGGVQSLLKAIAEACHISPKSCFDNIRARVEDYLDGSKLLILDEVHEVFGTYQKTSIRRCMSVLRQLQEKTQCGMVLCGTNDFRSELERGEYAQALKQLRKRGIWELQLEDAPTQDDLALIAKYYKLGDPDKDAASLVGFLAKEYGLGKYVKFMARAAQLAGKRGEKFTWDHFSRTVAIATKLKQQIS